MPFLKIHLEWQIFISAHLFTNISSSSLDSCCDWHTHTHTHPTPRQRLSSGSSHHFTVNQGGSKKVGVEMHCPGAGD